MRVKIIYIDKDTAKETLENVRYTDEIGERYRMADEDIDNMERELKSAGRFWLDADRFIIPE